jgi:heme O synthase-like polyprenyltransferase
VPDELYGGIASYFTTEQIVALTGFASIMIATNIINNVLEVDLDEYLYAYQERQPLPHTEIENGL